MKIACIYHSVDLDGWMSAAIVKHWFIKEMNDKPIKDTIDFIGYNYNKPIPDLSEYHNIIMCDISFSNKGEIAQEMLDLFGMNTLTDKRFIWIDHHISAMKLYHKPGVDYFIHGLLDTKLAACELTWMYFFPNKPMPEIVRLLGRYDCFGHKCTDEEQKVLEFQYGARSCISNYGEAYSYLTMSLQHIPYEPRIEEDIQLSGKAIYKYLCIEAKQTYKNGFEITLYEEHWFESGTIIGKMTDGGYNRKFICINKERFNPINFGIDYHKDGYDGIACFWYANGMWNFSLYNDNGQVDCSVIAKQFGGGGHKGASGFTIKSIESFITANQAY